MDEQKKKMLMIGGVVALAVVVIIVAAVMMNHKKKVEQSPMIVHTTTGPIIVPANTPVSTLPTTGATTQGVTTTIPVSTRAVTTQGVTTTIPVSTRAVTTQGVTTTIPVTTRAGYAPISTFLPAVPGGGIGPFIVYGADVQTGPIALVTKNEMAAFLSIIPQDFQFKSLTTRQQIEDAMTSPDIILPQDIPYLTTDQVKNLTDAQILSIQMGYFILFSKVNFTIDQLAALTPEEMKSNVLKSSQIAWTAGVMLETLHMGTGKFSQEQSAALSNILTNCP
jgi:hypothetical protein